MAELRECVEAEEENIRHALGQLPSVERLDRLSELELAGTAALLHSIYNGIENILKQVLQAGGDSLPAGATWHRDLLNKVEERGILQSATVEALRPFMAFRHFFSHAYVLDLDPARMDELVENASHVIGQVLSEVLTCIGKQANRGLPPDNR